MSSSASIQPETSYFYNQLEELAAHQKRSADNSDTEMPESDEEPASVPDQDCREAIQDDHPFLKYAVKLGYQLSLAEDALARLGSSATTDSLLKAVLYDYAALNPRKNRHHRRNFNNRNNQFDGTTNHVTNGKPYPSYMITQDSYQRFNGNHPDITALKSALSQGPGNMPYCKTISPPNKTANNGTYSNGSSYNSHPSQYDGYSNPPSRSMTPSSQVFFNPPSRSMTPFSHNFVNPPSTSVTPSTQSFPNPRSRAITPLSQELYNQLNVNARQFQPYAYSLEHSPENVLV